ncbi:MAG: radical SAM family heme chaperone HemW [Chitinispirillaceae bacterium]|jgi:oxygen-independent coproporphyrinogen-3 oxidase|nr:radical SAM family heme chaperone HemW [Chitinispirillaceae bacterium]
MRALSLYIHIPFCAHKCRYCDFYSVIPDDGAINRYCDALYHEIELYIKEPALVRTVFIGGGTPSLLPAHTLGTLCRNIRERFTLAPDVEWTVECNPESFTQEKAGALLDSGVNRLSFGMQSLHDYDLKLLGRIHSAARCREILADPSLSRFAAISVDLMHGLPGQGVPGNANAAASLAEIIAAPVVRHISLYELTIANATPFGRHRNRLALPGADATAAETRLLWKLLADHGFVQYEISNFSQPGHRCRHNEACWDHSDYLGLGCAAHSYVNGVRWSNIRDISSYITSVNNKELPRDSSETITPEKAALEMLFLGLRRTKGINEEEFAKHCGIAFADFADIRKLNGYVDRGLVVYRKPFWAPTAEGLLFADAMARDLA